MQEPLGHYIDLNPLRARMTADPTDYTWSSCAALCGQRDDPLLTLHAAQQALGATAGHRGIAYRALLAETLDDEDLAAIRSHLQQQRAYGRDALQAIVEAKTRRFAGVRPAPGKFTLPLLSTYNQNYSKLGNPLRFK